MNDPRCPTCGNPIGMTLKQATARMDQVMRFATQHEALRTKLQKFEGDLNERDARIVKSEEDLRQRTEKLASDEAVLTELMNEAQRPEQEFENLRNENQELQQKLTTEKKMRKEAVDKLAPARGELSILKKSSSKLSLDLKKANGELLLLKVKHAHVSDLFGSTTAENILLKRKNSELTSANAILAGTPKSLQLNVDKLIKEIQHKDQRIEELELSTNQGVIPSFAITDLDLLHALSCEVTDSFSSQREIVTLGSGPFPKNDFDKYLRSLGVTPRADGCSWIIVGREEWSEQQLNELIDKSNLKDIRVFSQELFVAGFLTTHDPFSLPLETLMKFAEGHLALEHLIRAGFKWPEVKKRKKVKEPGRWNLEKESPLTLMGYHVGETENLSNQVRRSKLRKAFLDELRNVDNAKRAKWGRPNTSKRLQMIATHIDNDITQNKSKDWPRAIREWKEDLAWLKREFYTNRMRFKWPRG